METRSAMNRIADRKPLLRSIATVLTCAVLGPPVGGIVFALAVSLLPWISGVPLTPDKQVDDILGVGLFVALFAVPFSYVFGGIQAICVGLIFAVYGWHRGTPPVWLAVVAGLLLFGLSMIIGVDHVDRFSWLLLVAHVFAAFVTWSLVRAFWKPS
jgi:hypothetical protein